MKRAAIFCGALALASGAYAADPQSANMIGGSCNNPQETYGQTTPARPYLVRVSSPASSALQLASQDTSMAAGDTRWFYIGAFDAGFDTIIFSCSSGNWTGGIYTVPDAPTSFSGVSTSSPYVGNFGSEAAFHAPAGADYAISVQLRQGAIGLAVERGQPPVATLTSSGTYHLGFAKPGDYYLGIAPRAGPPAIWSVSVKPLPIRVGRSTIDRRFARPGQLATVSYTVSGDAKLDAVVRGGGATVRQLATGITVAAGAHSIAWDGLNGQGKPVADGVYSIALTASDMFGTTADATPEVTIDTHPPQIRFQSPRTISPHHGVVFTISDPGSGYRNGFVKIDGHSSGFQIARAGTGRFVVTSPTGWSTGSHRATVTAFDRVGNRGQRSGTFRVR